MARQFLRLILIAFLSQTCWSTHECNRTITGTTMTFVCPATVTGQELELYDLTSSQLDAITAFSATGPGGTFSGPFTSIPPNICLMRNLRTISFASNTIASVDPTGALTSCLSGVTSIDLSSNRIRIFPSTMIYSMTNLANVSFQRNQLANVPANAFVNPSGLQNIDFSRNQLTSFEFWTFFVQKTVNFAFNRIITITNKNFISLPFNSTSARTISLTGNGPILDLSDAVYEMYNACYEAVEVLELNGSTGAIFDPMLAKGLASIDFGTTQLNCTCAQSFIENVLSVTLAGRPWITSSFPIYNASCTSGSLFGRDLCLPASPPPISDVDFSQVSPRLCKIYPYEPGNLTVVPNITAPTLNVPRYLHYESRSINPGACFFTFTSATAMSIRCVNDTPYSFPSLPEDLLRTDYMANITRVTLTSPMSVLPQYLCSLPSRVIDLSFQQFTTLTPMTFPCLDYFRTVNLASNLLTSVNMPSGNFINLTSLDLSSNNLTSIPASILRPSPSSLNFLDLRNNSITAIDLFLYTLRNITVNLDGNPINSLTIINPLNITVPVISANDTGSRANLTLPSIVATQLLILNDAAISTARVCTSAGVEAYIAFTRFSNDSVRLDCTCASISLKVLYESNGTRITDRFTCTNGTSAAIFSALTLSSCSNPLNLTVGCLDPSLILTYPHSETRPISPGSCTFTFTSATNMSILCVNGTAYNFSRFPDDILSSPYITNVVRVTLPSLISALPPFLCSLPSRVIDLSFQQFTTLTPATFPCLDYFRTVNLASNLLTSVNMPSGSFINLTSLDLSSNNLTSIPASILRPSPSSLNFLDLRNNSITAIDLLLYTLRNITVNLDGNPINSLTIINPLNVTVPANLANSTGSRVNLTLPTTLAGQFFLLSDGTAVTARVCSPAGIESYIALTGLANASIRLDCTCASISLKVLYANNGTRITDRFTCTNGTSAAIFSALTLSSCPNRSDLIVGCSDQPATTPPSMTTMELFTTTPEMTSGSTRSSSPTTGTTQTQSQTTSSPATPTPTPIPLPVTVASASASDNNSTNNTGLIVGLVVGIVGFLLLLLLLILLIIFFKKKAAAAAAAAAGKPVGRSAVIGQTPGNSVLQSRVSTRNPRAVRLAPMPSNASKLPAAPVAAVLPPMSKTSSLAAQAPPPRARGKGIPLRLDPIRSPTNVLAEMPPSSNSPDLKSSFRPINNSTLARPIPQTPASQPNPPKPNSLLNAGGDTFSN